MIKFRLRGLRGRKDWGMKLPTGIFSIFLDFIMLSEITRGYTMQWKCKICDFEMVELNVNTIADIIKTLNPNFLSLPSNWKTNKSEWLKTYLPPSSSPSILPN